MFAATRAMQMAGSNDVYQKLLTMIILAVILTVVIIVLYVLYKLYQMHFRLLTIGHSEPFDQYMKVHLYLVKQYMHFLHRNGGARGFSAELSRLFALDIVPPEELTIDEMTPENCFPLYINFMFKRALTEAKSFADMTRFQKMELTLIKQLTGGLTTVFRYADPEEGERWEGRQEREIYNETGTAVNDAEIKYFRKRALAITDFENKLGEMECAYKGQAFDKKERTCRGRYQWAQVRDTFPKALRNDPRAEMSRRMLVHLMFHSHHQIELMYDLRKTGGIGNFVIFTIYMSRYNTFVFKEQIPQVWDNFGGRVKDVAEFWQSVVRSDSMMSYMSSLPLKIAGIEGYENQDEVELDKLRRVLRHQNEERDVVEHFFLFDLIKAAFELAINLIKIVLAILKLITNPFAIVRFILGLIIGTLLFVLYLVVVVISPLFYIPAFFYTLTFSVLSTVAWLALYLAVVILFVIAWILDFFTNGFILSLFRCENLPSAWYEKSGFAFSNVFARALIFCWRPCPRRHIPNGFFCQALKRYQPSFCPQQLIMKTFVQDELEATQGNNDALRTNPVFFDFQGNYEYFAESRKNKKAQIETFLADQKRFTQTCDRSLREFDYLNVHICQHIDELLTRSDSTTKDLLKKACYKCYCKHYYEKKGSRMIQKPSMLLLRTDRPLQNSYLHLLRKRDIADIQRGTGARISTRRGQYLYYVNDSIDEKELERDLKNDARMAEFLHVPSRGPQFGFCKRYITTSSAPDTDTGYTPARKRGHIIYYMIYALVFLFTVSFGFMFLYSAASK